MCSSDLCKVAARVPGGAGGRCDDISLRCCRLGELPHAAVGPEGGPGWTCRDGRGAVLAAGEHGMTGAIGGSTSGRGNAAACRGRGREGAVRTVLAAEKRKAPPGLPGGASLKNKGQRPTLPPSLPGSTIGAGGLNFSVRNGKRCFPSANATPISDLIDNRNETLDTHVEAPKKYRPSLSGN